MKNDLDKKGNYEIFKTTEGNQILRLGKNDIYAIVETNQGHILVTTDGDHEKEKTVQKGKYYLIDFDEDPTFQDNPHLFLEKGAKFQELVLPRGLPTESEKRNKVIFADDKVEEDKIKRHAKNEEEKVREKEDLEEMEKKELDRIAKEKGIEGRSKMNKKELAKAIKKEKEKSE